MSWLRKISLALFIAVFAVLMALMIAYLVALALSPGPVWP